MRRMSTNPMGSGAEITATSEKLAWLREQLAGHVPEEVLAGELFRPRGAWGDRSMRVRRLVLRRLGLRGGLHELERRMGLLNLAVATPTRLLLFRLHAGWRGIGVAGRIAEWPLRGLETTHDHRKVEATRFSVAGGGRFSTLVDVSRILVLRIGPRCEAALEIDLADTRDAAALIASLTTRG
jgi:hypothetical protein